MKQEKEKREEKKKRRQNCACMHAVKIAREHMIKESYTVEGHSSGWNFLSYWKDLSQ